MERWRSPVSIAPRTKAALVSARELPNLVDAAVKAAAVRAQIPDAAGPVIVKWELIGRVLRDLKQAQPFADGVVAELGAKGVKASPAILIVDKKILAGFFEKIAVPQQRQF
jgi:hypothetical protein